MIQAPPKTGKSMFSAQLVDALDLNQPFLAWTPKRAWKCLYIQIDAPPGDWHHQLDQLGLTSAHTLDRADLGLFFLDDPQRRLALRDVIKDGGFEFVVWDAAEKLSCVDLNKKEGCQLLLRYLHETWAGPFGLVHHPRKLADGSSWRNVDEIAGHHYLAADASSILTLRGKGRSGRLNVLGRRAESRWTIDRDPKTYAWVNAVPEVDEQFGA
jgi:hypothetical protein